MHLLSSLNCSHKLEAIDKGLNYQFFCSEHLKNGNEFCIGVCFSYCFLFSFQNEVTRIIIGMGQVV